MSFVGPRPGCQFVDDSKERLPYYAERHMVKPGINRLGTDQLSLWRLDRGFAAQARIRLITRRIIPLLDCDLLQTLRVVTGPEGAR